MRKTTKITTLMLSTSMAFAILPNTNLSLKAYELSTGLTTITGQKAEENSFLGLAARTKYLSRWSILVGLEKESLNDHLVDTSRIAHMLALIKNEKFGGNLDPGRVTILAMYHDLTEIITDDMPTPIKYGHPQMKPIYDELDDKAVAILLSKLPKEFRKDFETILNHSEEEKELWKTVKYADTMSALIKCLREKSMGNKDFDSAFLNLEKSLIDTRAPEVEYFMKTFLPSFGYVYNEKETYQNLETNHFKIIYPENEKEKSEKLSKELENNYDRITKNLKVQIDNKTTVELFKTKEDFYKSIGLNNNSKFNWINGVAENGIIKTHLELTDEKLKEVALHEFTHIATENLNKNYIPFIFKEGIATYEANQDWLKEDLKDMKNLPKEPFWLIMHPQNQKGYALAYSFIEFVVTNYGYDKIIEFLKVNYENNEFDIQNLNDIYLNWRNSL